MRCLLSRFLHFFMALCLLPCFLSPLAAADRTRPREVEEPRPTNDLKPKAEVAKSELDIRHLDKKENGLNVSETPHFRILHDLDTKVVEQVGKVAEESR